MIQNKQNPVEIALTIKCLFCGGVHYSSYNMTRCEVRHTIKQIASKRRGERLLLRKVNGIRI
jgi:hypothetical protein